MKYLILILTLLCSVLSAQTDIVSLETFYHDAGGKQYSQNLFLTYNHSDDFSTWNVSFEYSWQNTPEIIGVNRVTQYLIWNDLYKTVEITVPFDTSEIPNGPLVKLDPTKASISQGDFAKANVFFLQSVYRNQLSPSVAFENYTLAEHVDRQRYAGYEYAEYVIQTTLNNRFQFHFDNDNSYIIVGGDVRYEYRKAELNYWNTYFSAFDLTQGNIWSSKNYTDSYWPGAEGMDGQLFFGPLDALSDNN